MAEDETEESPQAAAPGPGGMKLLIMVGVMAFVAAIAGNFVSGMIFGGNMEAAADADAEAEAAMAEEGAVPPEPAIYIPLDPPMLGSFEDPAGGTRYLQMSIQAMGRDQSMMDEVRTHAPAIRNAFLFLMSNYTYDDVSTSEGKEQLRQEMLAEAQAILKHNTGEPAIEEIYFTSLVVQ